MTFLFTVVLLACCVLLVAGIVEQRTHHRRLRGIGVRVLVNGSRGKSSITRLCAGALRGGGLVTVAKASGTAARIISPDGDDEPVHRKFGVANVIEQVAVVRRAATWRPDAIVVECMAVRPDLQELNQVKLIRSTIGVLCNVRDDHLREMGPTLDDVARSLSRSMPLGGVCFTAERDRLAILRAEAARRGCELVAVDPSTVSDEEMRGFRWITFKENVALALAVAQRLGIARGAALQGMWAAQPDPGVLQVRRYLVGTTEFTFANALAANDPESTMANIALLRARGDIGDALHVVINCRPDRVERNGQMGALVPRIAPERVMLIGHPTRSARTSIPQAWHNRVVDLGGAQPARELLREMVSAVPNKGSVIAIGNVHGQGRLLVEEIAKLETVL